MHVGVCRWAAVCMQHTGFKPESAKRFGSFRSHHAAGLQDAVLFYTFPPVVPVFMLPDLTEMRLEENTN